MVTFYLLIIYILHCLFTLLLLLTLYIIIYILLIIYLLIRLSFHVEVGSLELTLGLHEAPRIILYLCPVILTLFLGSQGPNMVTPP